MIQLVRRPGEAAGSSSSKTMRSTPSVRRCVVEFAWWQSSLKYWNFRLT